MSRIVIITGSATCLAPALIQSEAEGVVRVWIPRDVPELREELIARIEDLGIRVSTQLISCILRQVMLYCVSRSE